MTLAISILFGTSLIISCSSNSSNPQPNPTASKSWSALDTGVDDWVRALVMDEYGFLYAGGEFGNASGVPANRIARWSSASADWAPLGNGTNGIVHALAYHFGNLYAGGLFTQPGDAVARWNTGLQTWIQMGMGLAPDAVLALSVSENGQVIFAGGNFTFINSPAGWIECNNMALWNGTEWTGCWMGGFDSGWVWALSANPTGEGTFIGGSFGQIPTGIGGSIPCASLTSFGGPMSGYPGLIGSGTELRSGDVYALLYDFTRQILYVGGDFDTNIVMYVRSPSDYWTITPMAGGANDEVRALTLNFSTGELYAGGAFTSIGGVAANRVAKWDGTDWAPLGAGVDDMVYALVYDEPSDALFAGGEFCTAGGDTVNHVARWGQ